MLIASSNGVSITTRSDRPVHPDELIEAVRRKRILSVYLGLRQLKSKNIYLCPCSGTPPSRCVPSFVCYVVLEDGSICSNTFLSVEDIAAHFKDHLWEGKASSERLGTEDTDEIISSDFGEFAPGFFVGGLE
jgi:hypothetical protein